MHQIDILSIRRIDNPKPRKEGGGLVLAKLDMRANGFQFEGCALVRSPPPRNGLVVWLPRADRDHGSLGYADATLRSAVLQMVLTAYKAIGGKNAEWIPPVVADGAPAAPDEAQGDEATAGVQRFLAG